jgi:glycosyltransferase involved in cell wall biosynthesis
VNAEQFFETDACFVNFGPNGVAHYRTQLPAQALRASMFVRHWKDLSIIKQLGPQDTSAFIYSMPRSNEAIDECRQIKEKARLIVDVDDWLPSLVGKTDHPLSANTDLPAIITRHLNMVAGADLVTTSTPWLAAAIKAEVGHGDVVVVPNALDLDRFHRQRVARAKDKVVIGWSGSIGHEEAFKRIAPILSKVLRENADAVFFTSGETLGKFLDDDVKDRVWDTKYQPIPLHPHVLSQFHINIGPDMATDFYAAKSPLRALEAWAAHSAFIGGPQTYRDLIDDGVNGLLAESLDDWYDGLTRLVRDKVLRQRVIRNGRLEVQSHTIEQTSAAWRAAIQTVLS